jgi:hypothetical protein
MGMGRAAQGRDNGPAFPVGEGQDRPGARKPASDPRNN